MFDGIFNNHKLGNILSRSAVEVPFNDNHIAVIKESHASLLSRHELNAERKRILDMDIGPNTKMWNKMKKFVNERQVMRVTLS